MRGSLVAGWSIGRGAVGIDGMMLYQAVGISFSVRRYFFDSDILFVCFVSSTSIYSYQIGLSYKFNQYRPSVPPV